MTSTTDHFINQANTILEIATKRKVLLRLLGALAFRIHCPKFSSLFEALGREISDIDFAGYGSDSRNIMSVFSEAGFIQDTTEMLEVAFSGRMTFRPKPQLNPHIDVFLDRLEMSHIIDFRGRLELDYPTLNLSDMLLEKMQIAKINEKDIQDTIVLLREHEIAEVNEKEKIDVGHVATILADDWGFYYTVVTNLGKVEHKLNTYEMLGNSDKQTVAERIQAIRSIIEKTPKSMKWRMRAKIGTKKKWYKDIEEVKR